MDFNQIEIEKALTELHNVEPEETGEHSAGNSVDIEHMVREHPYYRHRSTTKE